MYKHLFPIFDSLPDLVYLDSAATSQKPHAVIERLANFYQKENANIHRGVYDLSWKATEAYESVRTVFGKFLNVPASNIAFTHGTTDSINRVARVMENEVGKNSNIVTTVAEHHANLIPWQQLCKRTGAELRIVNLNEDLEIDLDDLKSKVDENTVIVAVNHISNTTGAINPVKEIKSILKPLEIPLLVDGAQSAALHEINLKDLECDFFTFSLHKAFGPFGVGVLYVSNPDDEHISPVTFGGGAIEQVGLHDTTYLPFPQSFEPGTPNVAEVIASGEAIAFIASLDLGKCHSEILRLEENLREELSGMEGIIVLGRKSTGAGIVSFYHQTIHPHDLASFLNQDNVAVRAGLHCTQPLLNYLKIPATIRASFSVYNGSEDIKRLKTSLRNAISELA